MKKIMALLTLAILVTIVASAEKPLPKFKPSPKVQKAFNDPKKELNAAKADRRAVDSKKIF
ncbi:MAG: hypothetical protein H7Y31_05200 [Chitinophagaceae bacterium]|nr:hypothetical protein [Chitinophagaceae bacterium]